MVQHTAGPRILMLALAVATTYGTCRPARVEASDERVLRIELVVFRGLGKYQIEMVRREVSAIWATEEVRIDWSSAETTGCVRVLIDRAESALPAAAAGRDERWSVAATRIIEGRVSGPIYVSVDAAERVVRASSPPYSTPALASIMVPRVAGRAIAHELAHFLLNTRVHAQHGLLSGSFRADDFVSPGRDGFRLDDEQLVLARRHELLLTPDAIAR